MILCLDSPSHYKKWELCSEAVEYYGAYKLLFGLIDLDRITCAIFTVESSFLNFLVCNFLKKKRIRVIYFVDGVFEWSNSYSNPRINNRPILETIYYDVAYLCCDKLTSRYLNGFRKVERFYNNRVLGDGVVDAEVRPTNKILITTAKTPYFSDREKYRLVELIKHVADTLENIGVGFDIRIFDESLFDLIALNGVRNRTEGAFSDVVSGYEVVLTTPSSVSIEAMRLGVRVGHFIYRDVPITVPAAWNFHLSMDIFEGLTSILDLTKESRRDEFQDAILSEFFAEFTMFEGCVKENVEEVKRGCRKPKYKFYERFDFLWRLPYEVFFK